mmetsp:Transcript_10718/g.18648  ORF Transcript_10718/g.18648 Transcript_10718/m.18648 type:complete len:225 (+) Transcript_10718:839-1513(+)
MALEHRCDDTKSRLTDSHLVWQEVTCALGHLGLPPSLVRLHHQSQLLQKLGGGWGKRLKGSSHTCRRSRQGARQHTLWRCCRRQRAQISACSCSLHIYPHDHAALAQHHPLCAPLAVLLLVLLVFAVPICSCTLGFRDEGDGRALDLTQTPHSGHGLHRHRSLSCCQRRRGSQGCSHTWGCLSRPFQQHSTNGPHLLLAAGKQFGGVSCCGRHSLLQLFAAPNC